MPKYICCDCGKEFKEDTMEAELMFRLYGKIRCWDCELKFLERMLGEDPLPCITGEKVKS